MFWILSHDMFTILGDDAECNSDSILRNWFCETSEHRLALWGISSVKSDRCLFSDWYENSDWCDSDDIDSCSVLSSTQLWEQMWECCSSLILGTLVSRRKWWKLIASQYSFVQFHRHWTVLLYLNWLRTLMRRERESGFWLTFVIVSIRIQSDRCNFWLYE